MTLLNSKVKRIEDVVGAFKETLQMIFCWIIVLTVFIIAMPLFYLASLIDSDEWEERKGTSCTDIQKKQQ